MPLSSDNSTFSNKLPPRPSEAAARRQGRAQRRFRRPQKNHRAIQRNQPPQQQQELSEQPGAVERVRQNRRKVPQQFGRLHRAGLHLRREETRRVRAGRRGHGRRGRARLLGRETRAASEQALQEQFQDFGLERLVQDVGGAFAIRLLFPRRLPRFGVNQDRAPRLIALQLFQHPHALHAGKVGVHHAHLGQAMHQQRLGFLRLNAVHHAIRLCVDRLAKRLRKSRVRTQHQNCFHRAPPLSAKQTGCPLRQQKNPARNAT
jgi:hypothetical protein